MRRSKYGYLLLALLVITGLAGTITSTSITSKERKFAASNLKETKMNVLQSIEGLSETQLGFKANPDKWSVKECAYYLATSEKKLWSLLQTTLKRPANPEKRSEIKWTDDQLMKVIEEKNNKVENQSAFESGNTSHPTLNESLESFKSERTNHIKYIKSTTEDLRNHITQTPFGWLDCYQLCLAISALSNCHIKQIEKIKADPNFPKQ